MTGEIEEKAGEIAGFKILVNSKVIKLQISLNCQTIIVLLFVHTRRKERDLCVLSPKQSINLGRPMF